ncbi:MAG: twin-arginine translocase TatA/TatE family subunit [Myxococcota bacterium]
MVGFGMPGMSEWIVILVIVLIFFGAGKLPDVFAQAGKGLKAFKDASEGKGDKPAADEATDEKPATKVRKQIAQDELDDDEEPARETQSAKPRKD